MGDEVFTQIKVKNSCYNGPKTDIIVGLSLERDMHRDYKHIYYGTIYSNSIIAAIKIKEIRSGRWSFKSPSGC